MKISIYHLVFVSLTVFLLGFYGLCAQVNSESDDFSYALKLFDEQFYELAAKQFSRFVNRYPNSNRVAEAAYYTGLSLYHLKDYANSRVEFQGVAVNYPSSSRAADSWYMMGECYSLMGKHEEAAKSYEMVKNLHPDHAVAAKSILHAGEAYQQLGELEKAEQLFILIQNRYIESPEYFSAVLDHGALFIQRGERSKAIEKMSKVLDSNCSDQLKARALYLLGEMDRSSGYLNNAVEYYQQIITRYTKTPVFQPTALSLAQVYLLQNRYSDAQKVLNQGLNSNPPAPLRVRLQEKLGDAYYLSKQFGLALKAYDQSAEDKQEAEYVVRRLKGALCWYNQKNLLKGVEYLENLISDSGYYHYHGFKETKQLFFEWLLNLNRHEQGIAALNYLRSVGHFTRQDKIILISFYKSRNDWLSVIRDIEPDLYSEEKFREKDDFLYEYALACDELERYPESARIYREIVEKYASSEFLPQAQKNLAYLEKYKIVDQSVGFSNLAVLLGNVINRQENSKLQVQLGKLFENLKDYDSALIQFQNALATADSQTVRTDVLHQIGLTYWHLADRKENTAAETESYLQKAKENLSEAMAHVGTASQPDLLAWDFVQIGIAVEKSPRRKQIGYIGTLVDKYKNSKYREVWYAQLAELNAQSDSTLTEAYKYFDLLCNQYPSSPAFPDYLFNRAVLSQKLKTGNATEDYRRIIGSYPNSGTAARALHELGLIYMEKDGYKEAGQLFAKLQDDYYYTKQAETDQLLIADTYLFSGQYNAAIGFYNNQLMSIAIEDVVLNREFVSAAQKSIIYKLGRAYSALLQWDEAQKYLSTYLAWDPQGPYADAAYFLLGEIYLTLHDPHSAVTSFSKVSDSDAERYQQALMNIAQTYLGTGQFDLAAQNYAILQKLVAGKPDEMNIASRYIIALIRGGKKQLAENAISGYNKKFKASPSTLAEFQFEFGEYNRQKNNYDAAVKHYKTIKDKYSKTGYVDDADYALALTYLVLNRHEDALAILTKFPNLYPDSDNLGAVLNTMGTIYFRSEKYESAMSSFKSALEKPLTAELKPQVMSNLIKAYTFVNFWDAALALTRDYIRDYPQAADLVDKKILMGRAYIQLGQVEQAVDLLKETKLLADSEQEPEIQFYIGEAYFQVGQYESAITEFVKIPFLSRKTKLQWEASALYYSGQSYEKLGRNDEAIRMYEEIIKRSGIDMVLKKEAQKRIEQIK
jgi:tetratricopeptide (TPR) repeat protein